MSSLMMIMIKKFVPCKSRKTTLSLCISLLLMMKPLLLFFLKTIKKLRHPTRLSFCCFFPKKKSVTASDSLPNLSCNFLTVSLCLTAKKCYFNGYLEMRFHHLQSQVKTLCKQNIFLLLPDTEGTFYAIIQDQGTALIFFFRNSIAF